VKGRSNLEFYDIEVITVNDKLVSIGSGYVNHYNPTLKLWNAELFDVKDDSYFYELMEIGEEIYLKISTKDNNSFFGWVLISNISTGSSGTRVLLQGTGPVKAV
jgi:hypothetical protein